jgi:hypothetical protein
MNIMNKNLRKSCSYCAVMPSLPSLSLARLMLEFKSLFTEKSLILPLALMIVHLRYLTRKFTIYIHSSLLSLNILTVVTCNCAVLTGLFLKDLWTLKVHYGYSQHHQCFLELRDYWNSKHFSLCNFFLIPCIAVWFWLWVYYLTYWF